VDQLTEAITSGVLRALAAQSAETDSPVDLAELVGKRGIFGQVIVLGGMWPDGTRIGRTVLGGAVGADEVGI
jgi:hypothetical protein